MARTLITKVIIGNEKFYGEEFHLKKDFFKLWMHGRWAGCSSCFCKKKKETPTPNDDTKTKSLTEVAVGEKEIAQGLFEDRLETLNVCSEILNDRLDIKNYIQDSMDLQIIRSLLLKSRHKILMPLLSYHMTKKRLDGQKKNTRRDKKTSFGRNLLEGDDMPVLDIHTAVMH